MVRCGHGGANLDLALLATTPARRSDLQRDRLWAVGCEQQVKSFCGPRDLDRQKERQCIEKNLPKFSAVCQEIIAKGLSKGTIKSPILPPK